MPKYASGKHAKAISDRSGLEFPYNEMVREWNGSLVHMSEYEPKQPQLEPKPMSADAISLANIRPARTENPVSYFLPVDAFETYAASSGVINVTAPGHGLTTATTYRFRGQPTTSPGTGSPTNAVFAYANPENFDGISGSNVAKSAGYSITVGKRDSAGDITNTDDYYHFTVDTNTATSGSISGGGNNSSAGPATLTS